MPKRPTIQEQWESFARETIPPGTPAVERQVIHRTFYAGAGMMLVLIGELDLASVSEEEGVLILESLLRECLDFSEDVQAGRA